MFETYLAVAIDAPLFSARDSSLAARLASLVSVPPLPSFVWLSAIQKLH